MATTELVTLSKQKEGYYQLQFVDIDNVLHTFFVSESVMFTISELYNRESGGYMRNLDFSIKRNLYI